MNARLRAQRVHQRLQDMAEMLPKHPYSGQMMTFDQMTDEPRLRRVVAAPYPYVVFYEVVDDEVVIVGVRHVAHHA